MQIFLRQEKLLGYKPKTGLKEGLEREVEWIKELMK